MLIVMIYLPLIKNDWLLIMMMILMLMTMMMMTMGYPANSHQSYSHKRLECVKMTNGGNMTQSHIPTIIINNDEYYHLDSLSHKQFMDCHHSRFELWRLNCVSRYISMQFGITFMLVWWELVQVIPFQLPRVIILIESLWWAECRSRWRSGGAGINSN